MLNEHQITDVALRHEVPTLRRYELESKVLQSSACHDLKWTRPTNDV